jgi:hypothetical protein
MFRWVIGPSRINDTSFTLVQLEGAARACATGGPGDVLAAASIVLACAEATAPDASGWASWRSCDALWYRLADVLHGSPGVVQVARLRLERGLMWLISDVEDAIGIEMEARAIMEGST